jgi:hypothetical protein
MVAVFFTFAPGCPLPPKEMGIVLGVAVLLDAALVRLLQGSVRALIHSRRGSCESSRAAISPPL